MRKYLFTAGFGIAALASISAAQADSFQVKVSLDPGVTLVDSYFAYNAESSTGGYVAVTPIGTINDGQTLTGTSPSAFLPGDAYTFLGAYYDASGTEHAAIDVNSIGVALTEGQSWDSTIGSWTGVTEATVLGYLNTGSTTLIDTYIATGFPTAAIVLPAIGTSGTLMAFSGGTPIGSTSPVPEPASLAALGLGAMALIRRRRRTGR